jgi:hypothetical protein
MGLSAGPAEELRKDSHHKSQITQKLISEIDAGLLNIQTSNSSGFVIKEMNVNNYI